MRTILLLVASNIFMTTAWYGHLRFKSVPLWIAILASWLIALPEYTLQVPANRFGHGTFSAPQLKIIQESISIGVFMLFCVAYLREPLKWNHLAAFVLILGASIFALWDTSHPAFARAAAPIAQVQKP